MAVQIVEGDILNQQVDCIVNAWNRNIIPWWLLLPQGISGATKRQGGYQPFIELGRIGPIPLGGAVLTSPGRLPLKAIIHVAGISMLWRSSEASIRASVRNALGLAKEHGFQSIAFPLIGAGTGGGEPDRVLRMMVEEAVKSGFPGEVRIVKFRKESLQLKQIGPISRGLYESLLAIEPSRHRDREYRPAALELVDGTIVSRAYVRPLDALLKAAPVDFDSRYFLSINNVARIREYPQRLAPELATKVYNAGETGMGYSLFTVIFSDGTKTVFSADSDAVDFLDFPPGKAAADVVDVLPHCGQLAYLIGRDRGGLDCKQVLYHGVDS